MRKLFSRSGLLTLITIMLTACTGELFDSTSEMLPSPNEEWNDDTYLDNPETTVCSDALDDPRDGRTYQTVRIAGRRWMAENLRYETENSWNYNNDPALGEMYGRLYTWDAAMAACPEGWHLATEEDWLSLFDHYGGMENAYASLITGGESGFEALLSGNRNRYAEFFNLNYYGRYWSGTDPDFKRAIYYIFGKREASIEATTEYPKDFSNACRCVEGELESPFGMITDPRDGQEYKTVKLVGLNWLAENLNYETEEGSWEGIDGRLYTPEAGAVACPDGWRLTTAGDWEKLQRYYGGNDYSSRKRAYADLIIGGPSGFNATLGGWGHIIKDDIGNVGVGRWGVYLGGYSFIGRRPGETIPGGARGDTQSCRCVEMEN